MLKPFKIMYKKVSILEELPPLNKFVFMLDEANEPFIYRLTEYGWNMRDVDGINTPNNNLPMKYWLKEV